jgi:hypothetical protein
MRLVRQERGASLTEFAVVVPVFLAMIWGTLYFAEVGVFKLKAQEIARYTAWAFTQKPLSNYEDKNFSHTKAFNTAKSAVTGDVESLYYDLDAAISSGRGGWGVVTSATFNDLAASDVRNMPYDLVPQWDGAAWVEPLTDLGWTLTLLSVGTSAQSMVNGILNRLRMNTRGLITGRAVVKLGVTDDDEIDEDSRALARAGKVRGADLSRWQPRNKRIRDTGGRGIETTLLVDSWRVTEGFSAIPQADDAYPQVKQFRNIVREISNGGVTALPGGPLISIIMSFTYVTAHMPNEVGPVLGLFKDKVKVRDALRLPPGRVFSLPYTKARTDEENRNEGEDPRQGQVNIFKRVGGTAAEGAVVTFDTAPLVDDPARRQESPYLKSLNERGPNFMGCRYPERRGCWE